MADYPVTLVVPAEIYDRARRAAEQTTQSVERVLIGYLESAASDPLPIDEQAELDALAYLSDDALWTIAREQMPAKSQSRMRKLMGLNSQDKLSDADRRELEALVERGQRLTLRKAEAIALLTARGHKITRADLTAGHG